MPIPLGILAAAGFRPSAAGAFELLESTVLTGNQASVEFTNLVSKYGSTYQHLQIRIAARTNATQLNDYMKMTLNGDTAGNYAAHDLEGNGSNVASAGYPNLAFMGVQRAGGANSASGVFGAGVTDILDAFETTKNTTIRSFGGVPNNIFLTSGHWRNTAAVNVINIAPGSGTLFVQFSRFSLYGIKATA
jgi:hypothetical protein